MLLYIINAFTYILFRETFKIMPKTPAQKKQVAQKVVSKTSRTHKRKRTKNSSPAQKVKKGYLICKNMIPEAQQRHISASVSI